MHRLKIKLKYLMSMILLVVFFMGCAQVNYQGGNNGEDFAGELELPIMHSPGSTDELYCSTSDDCACGTNIDTGACFYGNKDYVNTLKQCPDFCTGIAGNFQIECVANRCEQVNVRNVDESYCDVDSDCVRKNQCCDCGLGVYVNKKYQANPCEGPRCLCAESESVGKCIGNKCTAVPKVNPFKGFCGTSTLGSCQTDSDCVKCGCSGQVCQSKDEEPILTTCEYSDCYNSDTYGLGCKCKNNKCQWIQTLFVD